MKVFLSFVTNRNWEVFYRAGNKRPVRKVRTAQGTVLPNGKTDCRI